MLMNEINRSNRTMRTNFYQLFHVPYGNKSMLQQINVQFRNLTILFHFLTLMHHHWNLLTFIRKQTIDGRMGLKIINYISNLLIVRMFAH